MESVSRLRMLFTPTPSSKRWSITYADYHCQLNQLALSIRLRSWRKSWLGNGRDSSQTSPDLVNDHKGGIFLVNSIFLVNATYTLREWVNQTLTETDYFTLMRRNVTENPRDASSHQTLLECSRSQHWPQSTSSSKTSENSLL